MNSLPPHWLVLTADCSIVLQPSHTVHHPNGERDDAASRETLISWQIIIIALSRFLSIFLGKIRQPRVIAEVVGGILLVSPAPISTISIVHYDFLPIGSIRLGMASTSACR